MSVKSTAGSKFYIGPVDDAATAVEFAALTYVEVKEVEDLGELGDESEAITFTAVSDSRVRKLKGARDAGTLVLVVGRDPLDPGQAAMRAAESTDFEYCFKLVADDIPEVGGTSSIYYFRGLVMSRRDNYGAGNNVVKTTFNVAINTPIIEVPAELAE